MKGVNLRMEPYHKRGPPTIETQPEAKACWNQQVIWTWRLHPKPELLLMVRKSGEKNHLTCIFDRIHDDPCMVYVIFSYICLLFISNVGEYAIHGSYGYETLANGICRYYNQLIPDFRTINRLLAIGCISGFGLLGQFHHSGNWRDDSDWALSSGAILRGMHQSARGKESKLLTGCVYRQLRGWRFYVKNFGQNNQNSL